MSSILAGRLAALRAIKSVTPQRPLAYALAPDVLERQLAVRATENDDSKPGFWERLTVFIPAEALTIYLGIIGVIALDPRKDAEGETAVATLHVWLGVAAVVVGIVAAVVLTLTAPKKMLKAVEGDPVKKKAAETQVRITAAIVAMAFPVYVLTQPGNPLGVVLHLDQWLGTVIAAFFAAMAILVNTAVKRRLGKVPAPNQKKP